MKKLRTIVSLLLLGVCCAYGQQREVRIGVLGLFHPKEIMVSSVTEKPLECAAGEERWNIHEPTRVALEGKSIRVADASNKLAAALICDDGQGSAAEFVVVVPGKLSRSYLGRLEIRPQPGELLVIVTMDMETAVASIVAAESPPHAPLEALKAQAVATRSFLIAGKGRHSSFDFCDTTHCQFLRQPQEPTSPAAQAAAATRGLVLAYKGQTFAAMYSASCGGRTHSLEELGIVSRGYPYFAVICDYCRRHPEKWVARISQADAANLSQTESSRLKLARKLGWKAVPGNSYSSRTEGGEVILEGTGVGPGIGLCQRGGADMALKGASFQQILEYYYPNTEIKQY
ncbi:MAG TPA: SpoIID/LytB domain-containing protein [Candidatus Angelobacter sp.]|nr:SpoIID/LytB domain-containing protein [Candidatus Angelobacter sp.]